MCPSIISDQAHDWFRERTQYNSRIIKNLLQNTDHYENVPYSVNEAKVLYSSCLNTGN